MALGVTYASTLIVVLLVLPGHPIILLPLLNEVIKSIDSLHIPPTRSHYENFTETAARNGYPSEEHDVVTEDGYILTMHRISRGERCKGRVKQPPVILMHGLLLNSDVWLDAGTEEGLAYLLADDCHDLWVGNQRGNYYGRRHKYLDPDKDSKFWNFSVDEIGLYDIPATIDYVLNYTGAEQVNYVGFSQGCGTFYIMCSERPGYCDKVKLKISVAPATRHLNCKSVGFRTTCELIETLQDVLEVGVYEIFARGGPLQTFLSAYCRNANTTTNLCTATLALFDGFNPGSILPETQRILFNHFPSGVSVKNMARYGQSMRSEQFVKFDYGVRKNLKFYGSPHPPVYNFDAVTVPVVIIYGASDGIVDPEDARWLADQLPYVLESYLVTDPKWTHFDNIYSQFVSKRIFPKISEYLNMYSITVF